MRGGFKTATGKATIRGRTTSLSGKKVSAYSPQHKSITGSAAPDRGTTSAQVMLADDLTQAQKDAARNTGKSYSEVKALANAEAIAASQDQITRSAEGVTSYYTPLTQEQRDIRYAEYQARLAAGKTGKSQSTQQVQAYENRNKSSGKSSIPVTPLLDKSLNEIQQIQIGKGNSHILGIRGVATQSGKPVISDKERQSAYIERQKTGKPNKKINAEWKARLENTARSMITSDSVISAQKINSYANKPITEGTNAIDKRRINLARNVIYASLPESQRETYYQQMKDFDTSVKQYKAETGFSDSKINKIITGKIKDPNVVDYGASAVGVTSVGWNTTPKKDVKTQQFKTVNQLKNEALDKELVKFAGSSKTKAIAADLYRMTSTIENLKAMETPLTDKAYGGRLPTLDTIAKSRDQKLEKFGLLDEQRKAQAYVKGNPALKGVLDFTENEYRALNKNPLKYGAEAVALAAVGGAFLKGAKGLSVVSKGATRKVLGTRIAEAAVLGAKSPILKKVAVQDLPMIAVDMYFANQIGKAYMLGAKVDGERLIQLEPGQKISSYGAAKKIYNAKKAGKDINWITGDTLKLTRDLAIMSAGAKAASKITGKIDYSIEKTPKRTLATNIPKSVRSKKPIGRRANDIKAEDIILEKKPYPKNIKNLSYEEALELGRANRERINTRKSESTSGKKWGKNYYRERLDSEAKAKTVVKNKEIEVIDLEHDIIYRDLNDLLLVNEYKLLPKMKAESITSAAPKKSWGRNVYRERLAKEQAKTINPIKISKPLKNATRSKITSKKVSKTIEKQKPKFRDIAKQKEIIAKRLKIPPAIAQLSSIKNDIATIDMLNLSLLERLNNAQALSIQNATLQGLKTGLKVDTALETKLKQSQVQELKTIPKPKGKGKGTPKPKIIEKLPIIPPFKRRKQPKQQVKTNNKKYIKAHRNYRNTLGSFESMFGTSKTKAKPKPVTAKKTKARSQNTRKQRK